MSEADAIRARIEALPVHGIDGYEWECGICQFHVHSPFGDPTCALPEGWYDPDGNRCDHLTLLDAI